MQPGKHSNPVTAEELQRLAAALAQQTQQQQQQQQQGLAGGDRGLAAMPPPDHTQHYQSPGAEASLPLPSMVPVEATGAAEAAVLQPPGGIAVAAGRGEGAAGPAGADGSASVFISHIEKREHAHTAKPSKRGSGGSVHGYVVRFYLVDSCGGEHLAAEGEDQGDAHYLYTNTPSFPFLYCHNKQDVIAWLEDIEEASKLRAGYHTEVVLDRAPSDPSTLRLPTFVAYRHEKLEREDGRHAMRWFLIDKLAHEHLAVTGEEKETRDGHYAYRTQGAFHLVRPLECGNQHDVARWLESMVVPHHAEGPQRASAGKATPAGSQGATLSGPHSTVRSDTTGGGSRGLSGGFPRGRGSSKACGKKSSKRGGGEDLLRHATTNLKRKAQAATGGTAVAAARPAAVAPEGLYGGLSGGVGDAEGRETVVGEMRKWAQEEAVKREATKRAALGFLSDGLKEGEAQSLARAINILIRAASQPQLVPATSQAATHQQLLFLLDVLDALRQLAHMYVPLRVVSQPNLVQALGTLRRHQNQEVSGLADGILQQWLRNISMHSTVLTDPRYVEDPRKAVAAKLEDQAELDRLVTEFTRRPQHTLGAVLPPPGSAAQGLLGRPGGLLLGEAATPGGGMSGTPSELSLALLDEQEAVGGDLTRTAERRRLDLSVLAEGTLGGAVGAASPLQLGSNGQGISNGGGGDESLLGSPHMAAAPSSSLLEAVLPMEMDGQLLSEARGA